MIKFYLLAVVGGFIGVWFGVDWYMTTQQLSWKEIWIVWPLWALLTFAGFLLGGVVLGIAAEYALIRDSNALEAQYETDKITYEQSVNNNLKEEESRLKRLEKTYTKRSIKLDQQRLDGEQEIKDALKAQKKEHEAAMKAAIDTQAEAEQLIATTNVENKKIRKEAHSAQMVLKRMQRKKNTESHSLEG